MNEQQEALRRARQAKAAGEKATDIVGLAREFVEPYGLDVQPPLEGSPFAFHDGGHRFGNIPATVYGELLQNVQDHATFDKLYGSGGIHGSPPSYREQFPERIAVAGPEGQARSSFVNYGFGPDKNDWAKRASSYVEQGVDRKLFEEGGEYSWNAVMAKKIQEEQSDLSRLMNIAEDKFKAGEQTFFQGAGTYSPEQGFMPTPDLRNTRKISNRDINTARVRGENYADKILSGYREAVDQGKYKPRKSMTDWMIHAADLSDAGMSGKVEVGRGWADEGLFPYENRIEALSNPPARIDPSILGNDLDMRFQLGKADQARGARALARTANAIRSTTAGAAALGGALPLVSEEIWRSVGRGDYGQAARQTAVETGIGAGVGVALGPVGGAFQRIAPAAAPVVGRTLGAAGLATLPTEAVKAYSGFLEERTGKGLPQRTRETQDTMAGMTPSMQAASPRRTHTEGWITVPGKGRRWRDGQGNFSMQQPGMIRTAPAQTARQAIPQLLPTPRSVPANTPTGVARMTRTQPQGPGQGAMNEARRRVNQFRQAFNPLRGDFGVTELLGR